MIINMKSFTAPKYLMVSHFINEAVMRACMIDVMASLPCHDIVP